MIREDRELLVDLSRVCTQAPQFALEFMGREIPIEAQEAYAQQLINLGQRLLLHAKSRKGLVLDAEPTQLAIDTGSCTDSGR
jgi:hypothetical protein